MSRGRPTRLQSRLAVASLLMATLLLAISSVPLGAPSAGRAAVSQSIPRSIPDTDVNPYGANFFLHHEAEPWKIEKTLQMAREGGIGWAKQHVPWEELELRKGSFWNDRINRSTWEKFDRIVDLARKNDIQVIARLDRPPAWTRRDNTVAERPPDNFEDFGDFVYAVVSHFKGRVYHYQIWNEPNIYPEWGDQPVDPVAYTRLLAVAYRRAKEADPNVRILSAPLAQTLEEGPRNLSELDYLEEMYRSGARAYFDVLFANGYGFERPPDDPADPNVLNFQRVRLVREIMERHGDGHKAIWFNEFGWNASPEDFPRDKLTWGQVSERQQADYTVRAIREAREAWPWVGVVNVWYFRQAGHIPPERSDYYFRMVDVGFTPRPVYGAIKAASEGVGVAGPGHYQESNPAVAYLGDWQVLASAGAAGGALRATTTSGASATIRFRGGDIALVVARDAGAGMLYVTVDGGGANLVPHDRDGRSAIDLASATRQPQALVPIASGLGGGEHVLRMTLAGPSGKPGSAGVFPLDGFVVGDAPRPGWRVVSWPAAGAALLLAGAWLVLIRRRQA